MIQLRWQATLKDLCDPEDVMDELIRIWIRWYFTLAVVGGGGELN